MKTAIKLLIVSLIAATVITVIPGIFLPLPSGAPIHSDICSYTIEYGVGYPAIWTGYYYCGEYSPVQYNMSNFMIDIVVLFIIIYFILFGIWYLIVNILRKLKK